MKINIKKNFFITVIYILIFQNYLESHIRLFKYFDEFLAFICIPVFFLNYKNNKLIPKDNFKILIALFSIIILGILSNILYEYQTFLYIICDMIVFIKFFLVYFLFNMLNENNYIDKYKNELIIHLKIITIILFLLTIFNYIFDIYPSDTKYGIKINTLFYNHATYLSGVCVFILTALYYFSNNFKNNIVYTIILSIILLSTLRLKAIGFVFAVAFIIFYELKTKKQITFSKFIILGFLLFLIAYDQFVFYFITIETSARNVLLRTSFKIMLDYFPLGTGFATFASHYSAINYSPVYGLYKINNIRGITKTDYSFVTDVFWPMIIGQFGIIGTGLYVYIIYILYKKIQKQFDKNNLSRYLSKMLCLIYLIIISTSESAFTSPISIPLSIILAL